ncbi:MAG: hypothetical protein Wins2KO_20090 [Winogradskyella sp.]
MSQKIKILSKTKCGELYYCCNCKLFHLVFNNLFFELDNEEFERLRSYVQDIEIEYWEERFNCSILKRTIPLPTTQNNLVVMFSRQEVVELRTLLSFRDKDYKKKDAYLNVDDIDYDYVLN